MSAARIAGALPEPPADLLAAPAPLFVPAPELEHWVRRTFIEPGGALVNRDHRHLAAASLGLLWTNAEYVAKGARVLGTAALGPPTGGNAWAKGRAEQQLREWFGTMPSFVITLDAPAFAALPPVGRCAVLEHELYHCAQARTPAGVPRFDRWGEPVWTMRGHDVEEFIGVVRRYGPWSPALTELTEVAERGPTLSAAKVEGVVCGTCGGAL